MTGPFGGERVSPEKRPALQLASPYEVLDVQALLQSTLRSGDSEAWNALVLLVRALPAVKGALFEDVHCSLFPALCYSLGRFHPDVRRILQRTALCSLPQANLEVLQLVLRVMRRQYFPSMADSRKSQLEHLAMYLAFPLFRWQIRAAQSESLARRQAQAILYSLARAPDSVCFGLHAQVMEPSLYSGCHLRIRTGIQASISRQAQYLGYHQKRHKEPSGAGAAGPASQAPAAQALHPAQSLTSTPAAHPSQAATASPISDSSTAHVQRMGPPCDASSSSSCSTARSDDSCTASGAKPDAAKGLRALQSFQSWRIPASAAQLAASQRRPQTPSGACAMLARQPASSPRGGSHPAAAAAPQQAGAPAAAPASSADARSQDAAQAQAFNTGQPSELSVRPACCNLTRTASAPANLPSFTARSSRHASMSTAGSARLPAACGVSLPVGSPLQKLALVRTRSVDDDTAHQSLHTPASTLGSASVSGTDTPQRLSRVALKLHTVQLDGSDTDEAPSEHELAAEPGARRMSAQQQQHGPAGSGAREDSECKSVPVASDSVRKPAAAAVQLLADARSLSLQPSMDAPGTPPLHAPRLTPDTPRPAPRDVESASTPEQFMTPQTSLTPQEFLSPAFLNLSEQLADEFFTPSAALAEPGITLEQEQPSQPLPAVRATDTTANGLRPDDATEPEHQQRLADVPPVLEAPDQAAEVARLADASVAASAACSPEPDGDAVSAEPAPADCTTSRQADNEEVAREDGAKPEAGVKQFLPPTIDVDALIRTAQEVMPAAAECSDEDEGAEADPHHLARIAKHLLDKTELVRVYLANTAARLFRRSAEDGDDPLISPREEQLPQNDELIKEAEPVHTPTLAAAPPPPPPPKTASPPKAPLPPKAPPPPPPKKGTPPPPPPLLKGKLMAAMPAKEAAESPCTATSAAVAVEEKSVNEVMITPQQARELKKIRVDAVDVMPGCIWDMHQEFALNTERLEILYVVTHSKDLSKMVSNAAKLVRLLETERWMQVSVACANFKMRNKNAVLAQLQAAGHDDAQDLTNHMVQEIILAMDMTILSQEENAKNLATAAPQPAECAALRQYMQGKHPDFKHKSDIRQLAEPEQLQFVLMDIPDLKNRMQALQIAPGLHKDKAQLSHQLDMHEAAAHELFYNTDLRLVLQGLLRAVNHLNMTGSSSKLVDPVAGFKLSCIHVLDIRGADAEKTSLVKEVMEQAMLQSSTLSSLPEQLANVVRACGTAPKEMREILAQLEEAQKQLQLPLANASGESPYDAVFRAIVAPIADVMPKYLKEAKARIHSIEMKLKDVAAFLCEPYSPADPLKPYCSMRNFLESIAKFLDR